VVKIKSFRLASQKPIVKQLLISSALVICAIIGGGLAINHFVQQSDATAPTPPFYDGKLGLPVVDINRIWQVAAAPDGSVWLCATMTSGNDALVHVGPSPQYIVESLTNLQQLDSDILPGSSVQCYQDGLYYGGDGYIYLFGQSQNYNSSTDSSMAFVKFDANGQLVQSTNLKQTLGYLYNKGTADGNHVAIDQDGNIYFVAYYTVPQSLVKWDNNGNLIWHRYYGVLSGSEDCPDINSQGSTGGCSLDSLTYNNGELIALSNVDYLALTFNADTGNFLDSLALTHSYYNSLIAPGQTAGNFVIVDISSYPYHLVEYDAYGNVIRTSNGGVSIQNSAISSDAANNVYYLIDGQTIGVMGVDGSLSSFSTSDFQLQNGVMNYPWLVAGDQNGNVYAFDADGIDINGQ